MAHSNKNYNNNNNISSNNNNAMYEQQSASASAPNSSAATATTTSSTALTQQQQQQLVFAQEFWEEQILAAEQFDSDFKNHPLPLARIKKVMKSDPEVKMISAEAPILFSKACETFICEITRRAWLHAEENKRRTLQRSDVANAVSRSDQFDFLIDIVPREEPPKVTKRSSTREDPAPSAEAYDEQQQQQTYEEYYPQGAGGLAAYAHAIEAPSFYQSVSPEQFQQYMQYQQQAQSYQPSQQQAGQTQQAQSSQQQQSSRGGHEPTSRQS